METFKRIKIEGWRQFEHIDIMFDSNITVLTGANSCGKTTILNVLSKEFGWNINFVSSPFLSKKNKKKIWTDLRRVFNEEEEETRQTEVGEIEYTNGQICKLIVPKQSQPQYQLSYSGHLGITGLNIPSHRPAMSYFQVPNIPTNPKTNQQHYQEFQNILFQSYSAPQSQNPGLILKQSLIALALFGFDNEHVQGNPEYKELFLGFQEKLRILLPKSMGFKKLEIRNPDITLITETGNFPLDSMSGGVSSIFSMAWQIHIYGVDKEACTVIIDEPENHLHPSMQRDLLRLLRIAFPDYKFIIATHSPFIVASDPDASVYGLILNENKNIISKKIETNSLSGTPNQILKEVLNVPTTIPVWVEDGIRQIIKKYDSFPDNNEKANLILKELKKSGLNQSLVEFME